MRILLLVAWHGFIGPQKDMRAWRHQGMHARRAFVSVSARRHALWSKETEDEIARERETKAQRDSFLFFRFFACFYCSHPPYHYAPFCLLAPNPKSIK